MQSSIEVVFRTSHNWHTSNDVLEPIFDNLDLPDLKSASLVCTAWCYGAKKAFKNRANLIIKDASQTASLEHGLERFNRHEKLTLHFDCNPETSAAALISSAKLPFLSKLILHYEGIWELVVSINEILRKLINGSLAQITELELRPQGDTPCVKPENYQDPENVATAVSPGDHPSRLRVLKVILGHPSMLEIDWSFLKSCDKLADLHLLDLDFIAAGFGVQLRRLVNNLPDSIKGAGLHLDVLSGNGDLGNWPRDDNNAVRALFRTIKPASFSLNFHKYTQTSESEETLVIYKELCHFLLRTSGRSLTRFVFQLTIDDLSSQPMLNQTCTTAAFGPALLFNNFKTVVIISLNVDFGEGLKSYFEFEATTFSKDLAYRFGPMILTEPRNVQKELLDLAGSLSKAWGSERFVPFGREYDQESVVRHYIFDESLGNIIERAQCNRQVSNGDGNRSNLKFVPTKYTEPSAALLYTSATSPQRSCPVAGFPSAVGVCQLFSEK